MKYLKLFLTEAYSLWEGVWMWIPGRLGRMIRKFTIAPFLSYEIPMYKAIWKVNIPEFVHFWEPWNIACKGYVRFGKYSQINGAGGITIGTDVMMGPYVMITTVNHNFNNREQLIRKAKSQLNEVIIENDVWIGGHCSILPGSTVPTGSVFTKTSLCDDYAIYAGIPAKQIKLRTI